MAYPLAVASACLALAVRPPILRRDTRWLDLALIAYVLLMGLQRMPVPPGVRLGLSPALRAVDLELRIGAPLVAASDTPHPLSVNPQGTMLSILVATSVVLAFWCARAIFSGGGVRRAARVIAGLGLALAVFGVAQHTTAPHSFYGTPVPRQVSPFGPYLNHSDFAMWLVMALLLASGYLVARFSSLRAGGTSSFSADDFDNRAIWLMIAAAGMTAGLVVGLSRSGLIAAVAGFATLWIMSNDRLERSGKVWLLGGIAAVAAAALAFTNTTAVGRSLEETFRGNGGRLAIWRATWPMAKDFWLTGIGAGAYERAMVVYQPSPHETYFNHAHNDYLQMLTEGGALLAIPAVLAAVAGIAAIRERLRSDRTPIYWVRAGAVSGLVAVAVQSLWETGLRVPANTLLFAVLAGIALHRPRT